MCFTIRSTPTGEDENLFFTVKGGVIPFFVRVRPEIQWRRDRGRCGRVSEVLLEKVVITTTCCGSMFGGKEKRTRPMPRAHLAPV